MSTKKPETTPKAPTTPTPNPATPATPTAEKKKLTLDIEDVSEVLERKISP